MKILMVNKFLYPKGGAETYVLKLGQLLEDRGHQVAWFGLANERNVVGNPADMFVSDLDFSKGVLKNLHAPFRMIYCAEARRKLRKLLDVFQPDVVHLNNIQFHLTPSVILETEKYRQESGKSVRIIYTAHDYQLICPSHGLFDGRHQVCEKCLRGQYLHCLTGKCIKKSYAKSFLGMLDGYVWKHSRAYDGIDHIICPSAFLKSKLDTQPRFREKTVVIHNFAERIPAVEVQKEDYVLEFGHLSRDKGTLTLLEAARRLPDVQFVFAGFGPALDQMEDIPNAAYVGFKTGEELRNLIRCAAVSVYPSEWYENCPFSVIESQICGTPVIGSRIGGIPELIQEGVTGELFAPGNVDSLQEALKKVFFTPGLAEQYSKNCRQAAFETPDSYYKKLMDIYGAAYEDL